MTHDDTQIDPREAMQVLSASAPDSPVRPPAWRKLRKPSDADAALRHISMRLVDELDSQEHLDPEQAKRVTDVLVILKKAMLDDRERELEERGEAIAKRERDCLKVMREMEAMMAEERRG